MIPPRDNLHRFSRNIVLTLVVFLVLVVTFGLYVHSEKQIDRANERRHQSFVLADELRQSSDDLTRMVRTYVITGNPVYKRHFLEILAIRDGRMPRPVAYHDIYWDLVQVDDKRPRPSSGQAVPLLELMHRAGFTQEELSKLAQAKANSDELTRIEFTAMALIESPEPSQAKREQAYAMLHGAIYHQAKADIMRPISEFHRMVDKRTLDAVHAAELHARAVLAVVVVFALLLVYTLWHAYRALHATLGGSADDLYARIARLGRGDISSPIPVAPGMENSVMGWLSETQIKLAGIDTERRDAEAALHALNETLEQRVEQETAVRVEQEQMLVRQSRLAAMGEMIGNIAHQWRQPLNALGVLLANIKDAYEYNELDAAYLDREVEQGRRLITRMSSTIDDFRNFFKPNKEKLNFVVSDGVEDAIKLVRDSFESNDIEIAVDKPAQPCTALGYPNEFVQVMLNVLSNAKDVICDKHIHGKVHIHVENGGEGVTVSIRDNGGGIPEEILSNMFKPYFTTKEKGTGIGLYMSRTIMHHMGGGISLRNIEGGVEVVLTLPMQGQDAGNAGQGVAD